MSNANIQSWQSHNRRKFKSCPRNQNSEVLTSTCEARLERASAFLAFCDEVCDETCVVTRPVSAQDDR